LAATGGAQADAAVRIERLAEEARALAPAPADVARRVDYISRALLGVRYRANTLIGGPRRAEQFVVRADAFDCVTYCETVLAAALSRSYSDFETALKRIRYRNGEVTWAERNHYFAEWCARAAEIGVCRPLAIEGVVTIEKTVDWNNLGRRQVSMAGVSRATLLANRHLLTSGDIAGFVSRRSNLDYFHTGLLVVGSNGGMLLRHASQSRARVLEERLDRFLAVNRVRFVTLLRPIEKSVAA
jgi:hypothetical protein